MPQIRGKSFGFMYDFFMRHRHACAFILGNDTVGLQKADGYIYVPCLCKKINMISCYIESFNVILEFKIHSQNKYI